MRARSTEGVGVGVPPETDAIEEVCAVLPEESVAEGVGVKVLAGADVTKELGVPSAEGAAEGVGVGVGAAAALPGGT